MRIGLLYPGYKIIVASKISACVPIVRFSVFFNLADNAQAIINPGLIFGNFSGSYQSCKVKYFSKGVCFFKASDGRR